jgi:hypothetical protein
MTERLSNLGYFGLVKEVTKGVPLTPTDWVPLYNETMDTQGNFIDQNPIFGQKYEIYNTLQGQRSHKGDVTLLAEPNTTARLMDMLLTKTSSATTYTFTVTSANATVGATYTNNGITFTVSATIAAQTTLVTTATGAPTASGVLTKATGTGDATITYSAFVAGTTTHLFGLSNTQNPNSYTVDVSSGNVVARYYGVEASKLSPTWNNNELQWKLTISALGSFQTRTLATVATTTLTLDTAYDPVPNKGLVVGDLVRIYKSATGATLDTTIATVNVDGITVTLGASAAAFAAGDTIALRPATVTYNLLPSFLWAKNYWGFGATAAAALTNATSTLQTRVEQGSNFDIMHDFESDDGADRSGSFDPAALVRTTGKLACTVKKAFDTTEDLAAFNNLTKSAIVISHKAGTTNQYEFRVTANHIKTDGQIFGNLKNGEIQYENLTVHPIYDQTDSQGMGFSVTNAITTL